jgi:putative ATPase
MSQFGSNKEPLASRSRPKSLGGFVGQEHLVGDDKPLKVAIDNKNLFSFILWGPPGCGKTTLARIYASALSADFFELSAVSAGKEDIRKIISIKTDNRKILFLDEIHRFNKAQQDFLLPFVEKGDITLIGATTENPSFEVISALLSRCRVFTLHELSHKEIIDVLHKTEISISDEVAQFISDISMGDARQALTILQNTSELYGSVDVENIKKLLENGYLRYDKKGEEHYNVISAFIKSMRASQENAAIYYLARMIDAGEDPKFIARRMVIFASEDIGVAQPTALVVANEVFRAVETIGYPECRINLAHGVVYLCQCKKDRRAYNAIEMAISDVKKYGALPVPLKIRNAVTKLMKDMDYGKDYEIYDEKEYLPEKLKGKKYFK